MNVSQSLHHRSATPAPTIDERCFPETGFCISGCMSECWEAMLAETALRCVLTPHDTARLGYELARGKKAVLTTSPLSRFKRALRRRGTRSSVIAWR